MTIKIAGCDLGNASASFVIAKVESDGTFDVENTAYISHDGNPFEVFKKWYRENNVVECAALGVTGLYAGELVEPALVLPEDACQEADRLAQSAGNSIPITARCSVFAKSEMTHYANQGKPTSELFKGFFGSVARNAGALLSKNEAVRPVYLIGGLTRIHSFVEAFSGAVGKTAVLPENRLTLEAEGGASIAAGHVNGQGAFHLSADPDKLIHIQKNALRCWRLTIQQKTGSR